MIFVSLIVDMQPCLGRVIVGSEGFQIHENWGLDGLKIVKNRGLGGSWSGFGSFFVIFGETVAWNSQKVVARRGPRSLKRAPSWSKSGPSWPMLALRWRLGAQLGGFGDDFRSIWHRFWEHLGTWVG